MPGRHRLDPGVQVMNLSDIKALAVGLYSSVAQKNNGTVFTWGFNFGGVLGTGPSVTQETIPAQVPGLSDVIAIDAYGFTTLALKADGSVWGWGSNMHGCLGFSNDTSTWYPVQLPVSNVKAISAGWQHVLFTKRDGSLWSMGGNVHGALGDGSNSLQSIIPVPVVGMNNVAAASAGYDHSLVLKAGGSLWSWGDNAFAQLGTGSYTPTLSNVPVQITFLPCMPSVLTAIASMSPDILIIPSPFLTSFTIALVLTPG